MDIKDAVTRAKTYVAEVFGTDGGIDFALEEVDFDHDADDWLITISFKRQTAIEARQEQAPWIPRGYPGMVPRFQKIVRVNQQSGKVVSVKNREPDLAA